jgi:multidrug efflux pump
LTGLVDWAGARARMILAFILLSLVAGTFAYRSLPKEGEPDIEIPAVNISLPFPGISAEDAEELLVRPMETELSDIDGLDTMTAIAAEGYANVTLEFEFGWDKTAVLADVRDAMSKAEADFPDGYEQYSISEFNFSEFPILIVALSGDLPERTLQRAAEGLQDRLEGLDAILRAPLAGHREEMVEVVIDPIRLESYNVTAAELLSVVQNNNQLVAAGDVDTASGSNAVKIDAAFDEPRDVYDLPVKVNGDRVVTLGDIADIRLTFEDREGTARFDGDTTVALQIVKRKGFNLIETADLVREEVGREVATWPPELREAVDVVLSNDQSRTVNSMVEQLEGAVLTAVALVMIVVLAALGIRSALLVGFAIPTSFLLCFAFLAVMGISISNIVMFGLILAVGMLVDGAIVVVEYADKRMEEGAGPMTAYTDAAKRMFWPIVSSTATTLCAFLPMLFWPGVPGEFMGMLPVTLIFVLSASLIVALIYLPVLGGSLGRLTRAIEGAQRRVSEGGPPVRAAVVPAGLGAIALGVLGAGALMRLVPAILGAMDQGAILVSVIPALVLAALAVLGLLACAAVALAGAVAVMIGVVAGLVFLAGLVGRAWRRLRGPREERVEAGERRNLFGRFVAFLVQNPVMPLVVFVTVLAFWGTVLVAYMGNNRGVEFFVETEPEQAMVYVRARGNLSLEEKDAILRDVEAIVLEEEGVSSAFAFAGAGGLNSDAGGGGPRDTVGQVQIETIPWETRADVVASGATDLTLEELDGDRVLARLEARLAEIPGIYTEITDLAQGPAQGKPVHLRLAGDDLGPLREAAAIVRARMEETDGLAEIEDTLPLPGIDWRIDVDVEKAGRFGADVQAVGAMVQLVTRGLILDTMRVDSSDEEIDIRARLPEEARVLSTLDTLKVRTNEGLVPLSNFITREPAARLAQIDRVDQERYYDVKADVGPMPDGSGANANERIGVLTDWLEAEEPLPAGVEWEWTGDQEEQAESQAFLTTAFAAALGLMFVILLAQFNSVYNAVLVLTAVVLSISGVLIGMMVMGQPFSIIMTGTGIVALAGIVVNNNIVLIDTYQEYSAYMPRTDAIVRTAQSRIRPVLLTTITTMAGLAPMMFGLSLDFFGGGYTIDSPTALWWKQLATAVVFGLGMATVLTLVFTPSMLALRVWLAAGAYRTLSDLRALSGGPGSDEARDRALGRAARDLSSPEIVWEEEPPAQPAPALKAAE